MNQARKRVLSLVKNGALDAAVTAAADFVRRNPGQPEYLWLLAQAEEVAGYAKAAIRSVSKAIALAPQEPAYRFQRGRLQLQINALAECIADMNSVLDLAKIQGNADAIRAAVAYRDEALRRLQLAQAKNPPPSMAGRPVPYSSRHLRSAVAA